MTIDINAESDDKRDKQIRVTSEGVNPSTISLQIMTLNEDKGFFVVSNEIILSKIEATILAQIITTYYGQADKGNSASK